MKIGVVTFPGSNCDADARHAGKLIGAEVHALWHKDSELPKGLDLIILPGGFSYGDYLRTGSIARFSPIMQQVIEYANGGGHVLGVCNGFQVLCEAGLLPGALARNEGLSFVCKDVHLKVENASTPFTNTVEKGTVLRIPVAHGDGRYVADSEVIKKLEDNGQVVFRYTDLNGERTSGSNPNGSMNDIAGVINEGGNVLGMMPHPERAAEDLLGSSDGLAVFNSILAHVDGQPAGSTV